MKWLSLTKRKSPIKSNIAVHPFVQASIIAAIALVVFAIIFLALKVVHKF